MRRTMWWIGACLAIGCGSMALWFFLEGRSWHRRFDQWLAARPVDLEIDLSGVGIFESPLLQTCSIAHAEVFEVLTAQESSGRPPGEQSLAGLRATLRILDHQGRVVVAESWPPTYKVLGPRSEGVILFRVIPFAEGRYRMRVEVSEGAPALAGVKQRLVGRYELCGLERMPGTVAYVISGGAGFVAVSVGGVVLVSGIGQGADRRGRASGAGPAGIGTSG